MRLAFRLPRRVARSYLIVLCGQDFSSRRLANAPKREYERRLWGAHPAESGAERGCLPRPRRRLPSLESSPRYC